MFRKLLSITNVASWLLSKFMDLAKRIKKIREKRSMTMQDTAKKVLDVFFPIKLFSAKFLGKSMCIIF